MQYLINLYLFWNRTCQSDKWATVTTAITHSNIWQGILLTAKAITTPTFPISLSSLLLIAFSAALKKGHGKDRHEQTKEKSLQETLLPEVWREFGTAACISTGTQLQLISYHQNAGSNSPNTLYCKQTRIGRRTRCAGFSKLFLQTPQSETTIVSHNN